MTKPRTSTTRELYGILGKIPCASSVQKVWNAYFSDNGIDAFMDRYPCTAETLPERLSEMFHFDRRMYIVGDELVENMLPLLDTSMLSTQQHPSAGAVFLVLNRGGVFEGRYASAEIVENPEDCLEKTFKIS